jgi:folate-binding protein YgfZ
MTDKQDANSGRFPLPGWRIVEAQGRDAAAFLQAQTMNDVGALSAHHWQWNGWLNPKGRLIALFALVALDAERYWLVVPDFPADELVQRLQRYVFRSKLTLRVREELHVFGEFAKPIQALGSEFDGTVDAERESVELDLGAQDGARCLRIEGCAADDDHTSSSGTDAARWIAFDLAHGLPRLPIEQSEQWTPQMLSLERLNAYSLKKGCYPGQEIVARTHYLGQAKRALVRIGGSGFAAGAEILADGRMIGSIACASGDQALAVLNADRPDDGWECAGSPCRELPLLDGLAR